MIAAITPPAIDVFHSVEFGGCFLTCKKHQSETKTPIANIRNIEIYRMGFVIHLNKKRQMIVTTKAKNVIPKITGHVYLKS